MVSKQYVIHGQETNSHMLQLCMTQQKSKILCAAPKTLHSQKKKKKEKRKKQKGKRHQKKRKRKTQTTLMNIVAKFFKYVLANQI